MTSTLSPRDSGKFIAENAEFVKLNQTGIANLATIVEKKLKEGEISIRGFSESPVHPNPGDPECLDALLVMDALNFSFWTPDNQPKWTVELDGVKHTGYFALCAALMRAKREGVQIWCPEVYSKLSKSDLEHILRSATPTKAPLMEERLNCLKEVGTELIKNCNGSFKTIVDRCENSAEKLLNLIVTHFPCFRDEADYNGKRVSIYKRAQILVADVWSCFQGLGAGSLPDIDSITMFADYRVPQMLLHYGCLEYTPALQQKIADGEELPAGSEEEVEIRGCSIAAVDAVCDEVAARSTSKGILFNAVLLDQWLWTERRKVAEQVESLGYHKTRTIFY